MITRAKIIKEVSGSNGCRWYVNIPILYGKPDSLKEKALFQQETDNVSAVVSTKSSTQKSLLQKFLSQNVQQIVTTNTNNSVAASDKEFLTEAVVCGIPNSKIHFNKGDVVLVGFENNDMGSPVILGSLLTQELEGTTSSRMSIQLDTLVVNEQAVLPMAKTKFKLSDTTNQLLKGLDASVSAEILCSTAIAVQNLFSGATDASIVLPNVGTSCTSESIDDGDLDSLSVQ